MRFLLEENAPKRPIFWSIKDGFNRYLVLHITG